MKTLFVAAVLLVALSCQKSALQTKVTNVNGIKLQLLFEHDGCKMYRFDDYYTIYWSDCRGKTAYNYQSGKTTHKQQTISE